MPGSIEKNIKILLNILIPKSSDFLLDLHRSLAHQGSAKILDISTPMSFRDGFRELLEIDVFISRILEKKVNERHGYWN